MGNNKFNFLTRDYFLKEYIEIRRTDQQLADYAGCSSGTIKNFRKKYGIKANMGHCLLGKQFGDLTVIKEAGRNRWCQIMWLCKCKCGNEKIIHGRNLECGDSKTCGCGKFGSGKNNSNWKGYEKMPGSFWYHLKYGAGKRKLDFLVDQEETYKLLENQQFKCALSNLPIGFNNTTATASLDRKDSSKGYTIDNVWWLHKDVNIMKWDFDLNYFLDLCYLIQMNKDDLPKISINEFVKKVNWKGHGNISAKHWGGIKKSAKSIKRGKNRNLIFEVTIEQAWQKYLNQHGRCALSGIPIQLNQSTKDYNSKTASLDRINSTKGYIIDNIWWVHKDVNKMKWKLDCNYFIDLCKIITIYTGHEINNLDFLYKGLING